MATADELLNAVSDVDKTLVIDSDLRTITIPRGINNLGVESDEGVLILKFQMPKTYCGIDLSSFNISINYVNARAKEDVYDVDDISVYGDTIKFSWLVERQVTKYKGDVSFNVCMKKVNSEGKVIKEFNTTIASLPVLQGLETSKQAVAQYTNILEQWRARLFGTAESEEQNLLNVSAEQQENIAQKGAEVLATIPNDYTTTSQNAEEAVRTKGNAIVNSEQGVNINVHDSSDDYFRNIRLFGKTTQGIDPSPEHPQEITSAGTTTVDIFGKNLAHPIGKVKTVNGYTMTPNPDGTLTISGAALTASDTVLDLALLYETNVINYAYLKANVNYKLSCYKDGVLAETPGTKQTLADGTVKWGWTDFETQDRKINKLYIQFTPEVGDTSKCGVYATQIEVGTEITDYAPYIKQTIMSDRTIAAIPVPSGGNYTDANGQSWVCDEINFEKGVYIQRTKLIELSKCENWNTWGVSYRKEGYTGFYHMWEGLGKDFINAVCTIAPHKGDLWGGNGHGAYSTISGNQYIAVCVPNSTLADVSSNDAAIESFVNLCASTNAQLLVTVVPTETPLTSDELEMFKSLKTNYPTTTIINDTGICVEASYNADTKLYIDNAIADAIKKLQNGTV